MTHEHELPAWVTDNLKALSIIRELPKWPVLTVVGENVSPELGREICVRTTDPSRIEGWLDGDDEWAQVVAEAYGFRPPEEYGWMSAEEQDRLAFELGILQLEYLGNDRVLANRFEVPSGWCNWDGVIGTAGTRFDSKWPSFSELNKELGLIAETWPELTMTIQLSTYRDAGECERNYPFLTWDMAHGSAVLRREHGEAIRPIELPSIPVRMTPAHPQRGTDAETLRRAVAEVKEKFSR